MLYCMSLVALAYKGGSSKKPQSKRNKLIKIRGKIQVIFPKKLYFEVGKNLTSHMTKGIPFPSFFIFLQSSQLA